MSMPGGLPSTWDAYAVIQFLRLKGFADYADMFSEEAIDGEALLDLTDEELKADLGVAKLGVRKSLLRHISALKPPDGLGTGSVATAPP